MSMEITGAVELKNDLTQMADMLRESGGNGSRATSYILQSGAQPILTRMIQNAYTDPKRRSGKLVGSIRIGRVVNGMIRRLCALCSQCVQRSL